MTINDTRTAPAPAGGPATRETYRETLRRLSGAQKSRKGGQAYSVFVNRRLGRARRRGRISRQPHTEPRHGHQRDLLRRGHRDRSRSSAVGGRRSPRRSWRSATRSTRPTGNSRACAAAGRSRASGSTTASTRSRSRRCTSRCSSTSTASPTSTPAGSSCRSVSRSSTSRCSSRSCSTNRCGAVAASSAR